jgi:hypothetical protein
MEEKTDIKIEKFCKSFFYNGDKNVLKEFCEKIEECDKKECSNKNKVEKNFEKTRDKIRLMLKKHLELDNVSFLFGTGSSLMLGAVSIRDIPKQIEEKIKNTNTSLYNNIFIPLISIFQKKGDIKIDSSIKNKWILNKDSDSIYRWYIKKGDESETEEWGNIDTPLENFTDFLLGLLYISGFSKKIKIEDKDFENEKIEELIQLIKEELFKLCDMEYNYSDNSSNKDYFSKLKYHKKFLKSLLGRPLNLRRANIFTTNYDLVFENSFDELGIYYINGFHGFNERAFRPEVYDFDMYYPGNTTEGKVRRVEKVLRYFKLHGSLNWVREEQEANNIYGLKEYPIKIIRNESKKDVKERELDVGDIIIYPTSYKKGYTLDFPYSELFRQFSTAITHPQSVLFCIGYSFFDEHINDIIFQALSIPSFSLVIIDLNGNTKIDELKKLNDPRISILKGEFLGDFKYFADEIMPNFHELNVNEQISKTLKTLYPEKSDPIIEEEE